MDRIGIVVQMLVTVSHPTPLTTSITVIDKDREGAREQGSVARDKGRAAKLKTARRVVTPSHAVLVTMVTLQDYPPPK